MDADVEAVSQLVAMEGDYHGHAGIRRWWESLLDAFPRLWKCATLGTTWC
jgi:hypothetical protein